MVGHVQVKAEGVFIVCELVNADNISFLMTDEMNREWRPSNPREVPRLDRELIGIALDLDVSTPLLSEPPCSPLRLVLQFPSLEPPCSPLNPFSRLVLPCRHRHHALKLAPRARGMGRF